MPMRPAASIRLSATTYLLQRSHRLAPTSEQSSPGISRSWSRSIPRRSGCGRGWSMRCSVRDDPRGFCVKLWAPRWRVRWPSARGVELPRIYCTARAMTGRQMTSRIVHSCARVLASTKRRCTQVGRGRSCGCREGVGRTMRLGRWIRSGLIGARVGVMRTVERRG